MAAPIYGFDDLSEIRIREYGAEVSFRMLTGFVCPARPAFLVSVVADGATGNVSRSGTGDAGA
ncbi:MAG: hypothetical protein ABI624_03465 [Casimicrobiaceae bacterium]